MCAVLLISIACATVMIETVGHDDLRTKFKKDIHFNSKIWDGL